MVNREKSTMVQEVLGFAAKQPGYKAYAVNGHRTFGYVITPNDNVLVVNRGDYGGVHFTFAYIPSKETGSGCSCCDDPQYEVSLNDLERLERNGLEFAKKLRAKLYSTSDQWLKGCYWKKRLQEVTK